MSPRLLRWGMNLWPPFRGAVWDQAASIEFVAPGRGKVRARFALDEEKVTQIRNLAIGGDKVLPEFAVDVRDAAGAVNRAGRRTLKVWQLN